MCYPLQSLRETDATPRRYAPGGGGWHLEDIMTQIDLGPLNEDCIALRDGLACKCEEDGQPVLALTLRQIASRYQRLLNKLFAEQANDAAEMRVWPTYDEDEDTGHDHDW